MANSIPDAARTSSLRPIKRPGWKSWMVALAIGFSPFVLCEIGLRIFGWNDPSPDLLHAFGSAGPLFERHGVLYQTASVRQPFFQPQQFAASKSRPGLRIFCFGGSTVHGHPYQQDTAFPRWLELELKGRCPERDIEVLNCGGVSYASYRIAPLVHEVLNYQPDLIVVATGENEFLEDRTFKSARDFSPLRRWFQERISFLRIFKLARRLAVPHSTATAPGTVEVNPRLDSRSGYASYHRDDKWHQEVTTHFEASLREMAEACRRARVPLLLCRLGCDLRDCAPFKSEHREDLTPQAELTWQKAFDQAAEQEITQPQAAAESYAQAEKLDAKYALLSWRMARMHDRQQSVELALKYYLQARDEDICPLRLVSGNEVVLKNVAGEFSLPLLDIASLLSADCPGQIPGRDRYLDHVHPMIDGHQRIAHALANRIQELKLAQLLPWSESAQEKIYRRQFDSLAATYYVDARRRVDWLESWARREKLAGEMLPINAEAWLRLGIRDFELANYSDAARHWKKALDLKIELKQTLLDRMESLRAQGREGLSKKMLECISSLPAS